MSESVLAFGPFQLFPSQRLILESGKPLRLGSRALDILIALSARPGEIFSKEELIAHVWPDIFVEETNLRVHIAALRKALREDRSVSRFIDNIPGRGYCFVAPVAKQAVSPQEGAPQPSAQRVYHLPKPVGRLIGRDDIVGLLTEQLSQRRFVTIVGPGGIGKTTVALAVAEALVSSYPDGVAFLDLATLEDPLLLPGALAAALGHTIRSIVPMGELAAALQHSKLLIVLDSCERVIEAAAALAETLLGHAPGIAIFATSREPLRAQGEWVQRLPALAFPAPSKMLSAAEALSFPAVQLFTERASACLGGYELTDADAPEIAAICQSLDGIALAIELAAGRVDTIGIHGLAASLEDCFRVLTRGRRTALSRHQTLRATLDWSYRLLASLEERILRRLAVFNGSFTLAAAREVIIDSEILASEFDDSLMNLVAKSLIGAEFGGEEARYRLLDTTRTYAREKLDEGDEGSRFRQRHAEYYRALFDRAEAEWESRDTGEWLGAYGPHIGNLRAALDWAFSPEGDSSIGAALTVAAVPLWFQLSLVDECLGRVQQALASLDARPGEDLYRKMRLYGALGWPQMRAIAGVPSGVAAWKTALVIAENLGDVDYQLRALWALWVDSANNAEHQAALALAEKFCALASNTTEPADLNIGDRMRARSLHFLGDQAGAYMYIKRMLDSHVPPANRSHMARFQYDQRMTARITLARVLWVQGSADQALHTIESNVEDALSLGHVLTLSHVLSDGACALALLAGKLPLADRYIKMLHRYTQDHALDVWHTYAEGFRGQFLVQTGDFRVGTGLLRAAIDKFDATGFVLFRVPFLGSLAEGLLGDGQLTQAEQAIERALALCAGNREGWFVPELHRIKGEITLKANAPDSVWRAEASFLSALDLAREHKALSWELRAATGLARSWQSHGRARDARDLLAPIYTRFTEGVDTADLVAAAALLQQSPPSSNDGSPV